MDGTAIYHHLFHVYSHQAENVFTHPPAIAKVLPTGEQHPVSPKQVVPWRPVVVPAQPTHPTLSRARQHRDINEEHLGANMLTNSTNYQCLNIPAASVAQSAQGN